MSTHDAAEHLLLVFMPGAFAALEGDLRALFAGVQPGAALAFHAFIPSGLLAEAIREGAPAAVYVSANVRYMRELQASGHVGAWRVLAGNRLCMIARAGDPRTADVERLEDLLTTDLRVVTPQSATDPCGQYIVAMFARAGLSEAMAQKEARGELLHSRGSGDLPAFLFDGRADVGIFYASEAVALGQRVRLIELPPDLQLRDEITFTIAVVQPHTHPLATAFVDALLDPAGQALLQRHGFLPPPDSASPST